MGAAHPRSRGEHPVRRISSARVRGSSPLARGTLLCVICRLLARRLIPARAGNTEFEGAMQGLGAAHPRSRGEHFLLPGAQFLIAGSSPLARGTLDRPHHRMAAPRLIPARAGNTGYRRARWLYSAAHPRSRGEHLWSFDIRSAARGSSPLARGTRGGRASRCRWLRLIPARAGNTYRGGYGRRRSAAHPRSRGEHTPLNS